MSLEIQVAQPGDEGEIMRLVRELALYEREPEAVVATESDFREHLFGEPAIAHCLLARWDHEVVGFALYFFNYSTWLGRPGLYLEDLFVGPAARKRGVGGALLRELARVAKTRNCGRMEWAALDWNTLATDFYRNLGAVPMEEWTTFRCDEYTIAKLAED